ncbi:hypothetical protein TI39_contig273g00002 [Zymoseptoria brevis]|uniref:Replication regulator protein n=1 Tax=Zymoseptoria brevis TaxID=1047168 RepID=A0A0F4GXY7_9PEZI|nr:hypothetical protein TI39_contig273g00002 [Zymoseptoria brevis]
MSDSDSDQAGVPLIEDLSDSPEPQKKDASAKRKRSAEDDEEVESKKDAKKLKKKRPKKPKDINDDALDSKLGVNLAIGHMDSTLMADHIAQRTRRFNPDLSTVEAEDSYISEKAIIDTTTWTEPRIATNLPTFLEKFAAPRRKKRGEKGRTLCDAPREHGAPHTLIIAGAGLRAADITRELRTFQTKDAMVAKLFAKHIKLKEAVELVAKTRMNIGVGTPQRVIDLMENGALSVKNLERIVVDASHIDQKKRGIMDMKETHGPLAQLLARKELKERYTSEEGKIELLFY